MQIRVLQQRIVWYVCVCVSFARFLRQPFAAGDCVTFSGKDCLCQRCMKPVTPAPNATSYSSSECIFDYSLSTVHVQIYF